MIHFDTNFLIAVTLSGSPAHAKVNSWTVAGETFGVSTIAWAEYLCGPLDARGEAIVRRMFPSPEALLPADAARAAELFNLTGRRSRSLPDCMIAAVAIRCGAKLATENGADFQPFVPHGLILA